MDVFSDVLRSIHLQGTVYFKADFNSPWGMDFAEGEFANFHLILAGDCWLEHAESESPIKLEQGGFVVLPHGSAHRLLSGKDTTPMPAQQLIETTGRQAADRLVYGGDGSPTTTMICGHFEYERRSAHPLWRSLPNVIHMDRQQGGDWFEASASLAAQESDLDTPGGTAIVDRMAEVLLIQVIRRYVQQTADGAGFLAAISNESLARALQSIHAEPAFDWTVAELAKRAGLSRSSFSAVFNDLVGIPPMRYVTLWRMHRASELLASTHMAMSDIAASVGYDSEFAFAKAFKRTIGATPGSFRRKAG